MTKLEVVRFGSAIALGVMAIVASGGAGAGVAAGGTSIAAATGTAVTANVIANVGPVAADLGQAASQSALGEKVDWHYVTLQAATDLVIGHFGGQLQSRLAGALTHIPGLKGFTGAAARHIAAGLVGHEGGAVVKSSVEMAFAKRRKGKPVTWDHFIADVVKRSLDPKALAVTTLTGLLGGYVEASSGKASLSGGSAGGKGPTGKVGELQGGNIIDVPHEPTVIKKLVIAKWQDEGMGGGNLPVKVVCVDPANPDQTFATIQGYFTDAKSIEGKPPAEMERILGMPAGHYAHGVRVCRPTALPAKEEFELRGLSQQPQGKMYEEGGEYPPGLGVPQWEIVVEKAFPQIHPWW